MVLCLASVLLHATGDVDQALVISAPVQFIHPVPPVTPLHRAG